MKKTARLIVFLLLAATTLKAQKVYFIYLQTESQQPFYARLGEKIFNSGSNGYLIVPNLRDSTYSFRVGINGSQHPDQPYTITINKKDQGFIIKNFGEKGWGLFNINSLAVTMPQITQAVTVQAVKTEKRESNPFTDLLAKAADDSTIMEKPVYAKAEEKKVDSVLPPVVLKEELKPDTVKNVSAKIPDAKKENEIPEVVKEKPKTNETGIKSEPIIENKTDSVISVSVKPQEKIIRDSLVKEIAQNPLLDLAAEKSDYKKSEIKLKTESSTTMGIGLVFIDILSSDKVDTIKILIPPSEAKQPAVDVKPEEKKFLDIPSGDTSDNKLPKVVAVNQAKCSEVATDEDFINLRRKMVGESNDDGMITEARKVFKTKCFTTEQIKNISALFLNDESRYKFFDAAYGFVVDPANFSSLASELKDAYFINRFKAMLRL